VQQGVWRNSFRKRDQDTQAKTMGMIARWIDMNLIANTILARSRLIGSIRSRTHGSTQLKPPKSLKNHLQS
jgi:hypothetical protein